MSSMMGLMSIAAIKCNLLPLIIFSLGRQEDSADAFSRNTDFPRLVETAISMSERVRRTKAATNKNGEVSYDATVYAQPAKQNNPRNGWNEHADWSGKDW